MPIYEYRCRACANTFELLLRSASEAPECPSCRSGELEQQLSGFAVSSEGISKARVRKARRTFANSSQARDQKVAETEYYEKEHKEHRQG